MIKYSRKGGRPPKELGQKKAYRINLKLITEEYYLLKSKVKIAKTTISEFVRGCLKNGYVKERISVEQVEHIRKLSGMANNLNQIAYTSIRHLTANYHSKGTQNLSEYWTMNPGPIWLTCLFRIQVTSFFENTLLWV